DHLRERVLSKQRAHVAEMRHRHAALADLAFGERVIAVVTGLGREIEGDGKAGLAFAEIVAVERVRRVRGRMTGIGAEDPGPVALPLGAVRWLAHLPASPGSIARREMVHCSILP